MKTERRHNISINMFVKTLARAASAPSSVRNLYLAPPFLVGDYEPRACRTYREGNMENKVKLALKELEHCVACPRNCKVNRIENKKGACNTGR